jgi:hypothetical protein
MIEHTMFKNLGVHRRLLVEDTPVDWRHTFPELQGIYSLYTLDLSLR